MKIIEFKTSSCSNFPKKLSELLAFVDDSERLKWAILDFDGVGNGEQSLMLRDGRLLLV